MLRRLEQGGERLRGTVGGRLNGQEREEGVELAEVMEIEMEVEVEVEVVQGNINKGRKVKVNRPINKDIVTLKHDDWR